MEESKCTRDVENVVIESSTSSGTCKKRKLDSGYDFEQSSSNYTGLENCSNRGFDSPEMLSVEASVELSDQIVDGDLVNLRFVSDHIPASCCSSDYSSSQLVDDCFRSVDQKAKSFEIDNISRIDATTTTTPLSEHSENAQEMDSSSNKSAAKNRRRFPSVNMPSATEIEEFFSTAEKLEQNRFTARYNYDVVKDSPMEGRYEWIRLKP